MHGHRTNWLLVLNNTMKPSRDIAELTGQLTTVRTKSPAIALLIVVLAIFSVEFVLMVILHLFPRTPWYLEVIVDSASLSGLLLPVLYLLLFRPLTKNLILLRQMSESLKAQRDHLEDLVGHRTDELIARDHEIVDREEHYRAVVESATDGILTLDKEGLIVRANAAAARMFGYPPDELVGRSMAMLLTTASAEKCLGPAGAPRPASSLGLDGSKKDGETLPINISISSFIQSKQCYYTAIIQDISERMMYEKRLARLAYFDSLTGLPNRRMFHDRLDRALSRARRSAKLVAILFLDLDDFKNINDTLGHHVGDVLLQKTAKRLVAIIREGDTVARLGGDEFTIILEDIRVVTEVEAIAEKILQTLSNPLRLGSHDIYVTSSIGITYYPIDDSEADKLIMDADSAMYKAKLHGKNTFELYTPELRSAAAERLAMDVALRKAVNTSGFLLHFQPEFAVQRKPAHDHYSGQVVGVEALVRWEHPELGLLGPAGFIPLSEEIGVIDALGRWVLRAACQQVMAWRAEGVVCPKMAVNVSARQIQNRSFVEDLNRILAEADLDACYLELELTESMILNKTEELISILEELRSMGITIAIDDFGTGHSSLTNLQILPIDKVKIDRSFIRDVTSNTNDATIAVSVIQMAQQLGIKVVAEGVETAEQLQFLYDNHCDIIQGYYGCRPIAAEECELLLGTNVELGKFIQ